MSFTGLSPDQRAVMLKAAGVSKIDDLFNDIPAEIQTRHIEGLPGPLSEIEIERLITKTGESNTQFRSNYMGGGAYNHYIPPVVDEISSRSEFYTAYTPYQPEVSQGTLAAIFEFQTMLSALTGMDVTNASMYDGATSMAEAAIMGARINGKSRVLVSRGVHPNYREVLKTYGRASGLEVIEIPLDGGVTDIKKAAELINDQTSSVIIQTPNFTGLIEDIESFSRLTENTSVITIAAVTEAMSLGFLKGPGELGASIVCGEIQSFGNPLNSGGPYAGYISARKDFVRRMPGRLVGQTLDTSGSRVYTLTLQTREQHIRREKATSNICTNEGLIALRAAVYLSLTGVRLKELALLNHRTAVYLKNRIAESGIEIVNNDKPFFNEFIIRPENHEKFIKEFNNRKIAPGIDIGRYYEEYRGCILVCATEMISKDDADEYYDIIREAGL
ncbi:MAG TPA: aminomethyl-transferring glycine dehydrogenase subunit GcvPA [Spirochaetota bacterium]|nr:aminomethyl-transferring glycine dehydrogenase subunit GcvPA [Spirochaetota bacterium]HPJ34453.1 aminomethyl-transferring glycine dehydrogenase subunit GcvPA [Spirochaetota bacterium]